MALLSNFVVGRGAPTVLLALQVLVAIPMVASVAIGQELAAPEMALPAEPLPAPDSVIATDQTLPKSCEVEKDRPLSALTIDIAPRVKGQLVPQDDRPLECSRYVFTEKGFLTIDLDCDTCRPGNFDVLALARFCHRPLYFEERCLERCGIESCCYQSAASAAHFYGAALLLPVSMLYQCGSCVPEYACY